MCALRQAVLPLLLLLAGCGDAADAPLFELRTSRETGITFVNALQEDDSLFNPIDFDYLYNGAGVAVGDLNGDGLQDLYFAGNMVSSRLYLNQGELRFADATEAAGVGTDVWATGVSLVDINGDGRLDIYVCVAGKVPAEERANLLFVNQGVDGEGVPRFREMAGEYGLADTGYSTHAAFFDYDLDGDLDLYLLTNHLEEFSRNLIRPRMVNGESPSTDRLYRNDGNGSFTNVSREAGILVEGYGLGVVVSDLNADGWPDVYVGNDFLTNDLVWINNRDGTFTNRAAQYLRHQTHNAMGVDVADINNDALPDIVVLDMLPPDNLRQKLMMGGSSYDKFRQSLGMGYEPQYMRNTLQLNNGPGPDGSPTFSEIGQLAGIESTDWSWAALLADFDNDGLRDLFVSNGYRRDVTNLDYIVYSRETLAMPVAERRRELHRAMRALPEVKLPNHVFQNRGDLTFADRSEAWGVEMPSFSNGAAYADLDNDGDLDLVVNNIDDEAFLFENHAERRGAHYLRVALRGGAENPSGFGARVVVWTGDGRQYDEHTPYRGYKSTVESTIHFGLGAAARVDSVQVYWPDGGYQRLTDVAADQVITVDRGSALAAAPQRSPGVPRLFHPVADLTGLASYRHVERELPDFKLTPLLPHKLSAGSPGMAIGDVDGNGLDDLYLGSDRGSPREIFLQTTPGQFSRRLLVEGEQEYEDMGALFFDADGDGDLDLYVVSGGGYPDADRFYQDRLYVNDGSGSFTRDLETLPRETASGSSVVAADYDGDGDLDLFVGGRVVPGRYPLPARSYLLRNDSDGRAGSPPRFTDVTEQVAPGLAEAGLVTSALWTDFDGDGRVDLVVAGEWMPLTFFRNLGGRFENATSATGLGDTRGWWNSLVGGDFDNDGDVDYVAGNLGLNATLRASPDEPVRVYAADFDDNGSIDPILTRYTLGKSYAVASRDILIDQIMPMKGRFPSYRAYAEATFEETLSEQEREQAYVAESVTFASSYLENRGDGRFALRPLPARAQFAPVFGMLAGDRDGDGDLDLLLVGNSHAAEVQGGWLDASDGTLLLGDGKGGFREVSGSESGFLVDGDAKALGEIRIGGSRTALLATRNGDALAVFAGTMEERRSLVPLRPHDAYATLTFADGRTRREELYHGASYLSQSSRFLAVPEGVVEVVVHDFSGRSRSEVPTAPAGQT